MIEENFSDKINDGDINTFEIIFKSQVCPLKIKNLYKQSILRMMLLIFSRIPLFANGQAGN